MAQCKKTCHSFIRDAFSPVIGVITAPEATNICKKNHLTFVELLLPFSRLPSQGGNAGASSIAGVHIRDTSSVSYALQEFLLVFKDGKAPPPQSTLASRMLGDAVGNCHPNQREKFITSKGYDIGYAVSTPWFDEYRDTFLAITQPSDHEYTKHFTACIFVASSASPDPMNDFAKMTVEQIQQQQQSPAKLPKWFSSDLLRYYILLHDCTEGEDTKAEAVYQSMKAKYSVHACHLLRINSVAPNPESPVDASIPDPWSNFIKSHNTDQIKSFPVPEPNPVPVTPNGHAEGVSESSVVDHPLTHPKSPKNKIRQRATSLSLSGRGCCLSATDHDRLKIFVHEFIVRALIPWAERQIRTLNEVYQSKKKGGFLKNLFGNRAKPGEKTVSVYSQESTEMQLRRLADLLFLFQIYDQAYQVYHSLKKDFESDKAWMFCAGAQEMAGLSVFMQGSNAPRTYPTHYFESAIGVYHTCKSQQFMTRAVLLSTEVLKEKGLWLQAATQFLRLTGEESDLRSALLLEQAAHCHLNMSPCQIRKYALHMVLAGSRYAKASQRKHAVRCYEQAHQVYNALGWSLAEDHIGITTSRLSAQLSDHTTALSKLSLLLSDSTGSPIQQSAFLREYLNMYETVRVSQGDKALPDLHIPAVVKNEIIITTDYYEDVTNSYVYSDDSRWLDLEDACVISSRGSIPLVMQRSIPSYSKLTKNTKPPNSHVNETQFVRIMLHNPLKIPVQLIDIHLEWKFKHAGEDEYTLSSQSADASSVLDQAMVKVLDLDGLRKMWVLFRLIPKALGSLQILSLAYNLGMKNMEQKAALIKGKQMLEVQGQRLNSTPAEKTSKVYAADYRLVLEVRAQLPKIKVKFESFPSTLHCGEIQKVPVTISNVGNCSLQTLRLACNHPTVICVPSHEKPVPGSQQSLDHKKVINFDIPDGELKVENSLDFDLWVRAPDTAGNCQLNIIVYFEPLEEPDKARHRCSRYSFNLQTTDIMHVTVNTYQRSVTDDDQLGTYTASLLVQNAVQMLKGSATEVIVTELLCMSRKWEVIQSQSAIVDTTRINQSEVALLTTHLCHHQHKTVDAYHTSMVLMNHEKTPLEKPVIECFMQRRFWQEKTEEEEEDPTLINHIESVVGVLWKSYTISETGETVCSNGVHFLQLDVTKTDTSRPRGNTNLPEVLVFKTKSGSSSSNSSIEANAGFEYQVRHCSRVQTDFSKQRLCVVPVSIIFKSHTSEILKLQVSSKSNPADFIWSGTTDSFVTMNPKGQMELKVNVTVFRYGVYNLNNLEVTAAGSKLPSPHLRESNLLVVEKR